MAATGYDTDARIGDLLTPPPSLESGNDLSVNAFIDHEHFAAFGTLPGDNHNTHINTTVGWNSFGSDGDDMDVGSIGDDILVGKSGDDSIKGDGGSDSDAVYEGDGSDTLTGGSGADVFVFRDVNTGKDTITDFDAGEDKVILVGFGTHHDLDALNIRDVDGEALIKNRGPSGETTEIFLECVSADELTSDNFTYSIQSVHGVRGDETLTAGTGDERMFSFDGDEFILGNAGDDVILGDNAHLLTGDGEFLFGGKGNDSIHGQGGDETIVGGGGGDMLDGGARDDYLHGGHGHDTLSGGLDDDNLRSGSGQDVAFGGATTV